MPQLPPLTEVLGDLGVALGLGLLVGLQRESTSSPPPAFAPSRWSRCSARSARILSTGTSGLVLAAGSSPWPPRPPWQRRPAAPGLAGSWHHDRVALLLMYALGAYAVSRPNARPRW
jgi:hypothetical protein